VIWESNAILKYIAERFDTERKLLDTNEKEKADLDTCRSLKLPALFYNLTCIDRALLSSLSPGTYLR
jgi:hypothetical protein